MERREVNGLVLSVFSDSVLKVAYVRILTSTHIEVLKINGSLESSPYAHLLNPQYIINVEAIKTRKNWILKDVVSYERLVHVDTYHKVLKLTELVTILKEFVTDDQEVVILDWVKNVFCNPQLESVSTDGFKKELIMRLNFKVGSEY